MSSEHARGAHRGTIALSDAQVIAHQVAHDLLALFHTLRGLSDMKMSVSSVPMGSVAISAVPMRLQTCRTSSGNCSSRSFSTSRIAAMGPSEFAFGICLLIR